MHSKPSTGLFIRFVSACKAWRSITMPLSQCFFAAKSWRTAQWMMPLALLCGLRSAHRLNSYSSRICQQNTYFNMYTETPCKNSHLKRNILTNSIVTDLI